MSKTIAIMSGKGGVGKSTLATALAELYARQEKRVVLLDGDTGLRCADLMLNLQSRVVFDLEDLLEKNCTLEQAMVQSERMPSLSLLAAPQLLRPSDIKAKAMNKLIQYLSERNDIVILDCPAGIGRGLKNLLGTEATPLIVATPDDVSVRDAERLGMLLSERGEDHPGIVFNRVNAGLIRKGEMTSPKFLAQTLDMPLMGVVPESSKIYRALLRHQTALHCGDRQVEKAIANIGARLLGADAPMPEYTRSAVWRFFGKEGKGV